MTSAVDSRGKSLRLMDARHGKRIEEVLDYLIVAFILLQVFLLEFFFTGRTLNKVGLVLIVARVVFSRWWRAPGGFALLVTAVGAFGLMSTLSGPLAWETTKSNFLMMLYPAVYAGYFFLLHETRPGFLERLLDKALVPMNLLLVANVVVVQMQLSFPYRFLAHAETQVSALYFDLVNGLFAHQSGPSLGFFLLFVIVYDVVFYHRLQQGVRKSLMAAWIAIAAALAFYVVVQNSTKAMLLIAPIVLVLLYLSPGVAGGRKLGRGGSFAALLCALFVAAGVAYLLVPEVRDFIEGNLFKLLGGMADSVSLGADASGTNERVAIVGYALSLPETWGVGSGFGASGLYTEGAFGFNHFGQADFGSLVMLGGIWFYLMLMALYTYMLARICVPRNARRKGALVAVIIVILLMGTLYTQCFTKVNCMVCIVLLCMAFGMRWRDVTAGNAVRVASDGAGSSLKGASRFDEGARVGSLI